MRDIWGPPSSQPSCFHIEISTPMVKQYVLNSSTPLFWIQWWLTQEVISEKGNKHSRVHLGLSFSSACLQIGSVPTARLPPWGAHIRIRVHTCILAAGLRVYPSLTSFFDLDMFNATNLYKEESFTDLSFHLDASFWGLSSRIKTQMFDYWGTSRVNSPIYCYPL